MELTRIELNTPLYDRVVALRRQVLRTPLGLDFTAEELATEANDIHLAACKDETPVACLLLTHVSAEEVKMRQVAVAPEWQGEGVGSLLVAFSERVAREAGYGLMTLHARETAVPFYLKAGYECLGEPFEEVTLPHRKMHKWLK